MITFAGAVTTTTVITQFLKTSLNHKLHISPQVLAYFIALTILELGAFFTNKLTISAAVLNVLNAILVATSASGSFDTVKRTLNKALSTKKQPNKEGEKNNEN